MMTFEDAIEVAARADYEDARRVKRVPWIEASPAMQTAYLQRARLIVMAFQDAVGQ